MTIGKEIKVVLSLDDAGFTSKTKIAKETVQSLSIELGSFAKSADRVEQSVADMGKNIAGFSAGMEAMQKSLQSAIEKFQQTAVGMQRLDAAHKESAKVVKDAAVVAIDAKQRELENELKVNAKLIESKAKLHAELRKLESDERAKSTAAMLRGENAERRLGPYGAKNIVNMALDEADRHERAANAMRKEIEALDALIIKTRQEQEQRRASIAALDQERVATLADIEAKKARSAMERYVAQKNAEEISRIRKAANAEMQDAEREQKKNADNFAAYKKQLVEQEVRDAKEAERIKLREQRDAQREALREQRENQRRRLQEEKQHIKAVANMWKGMAQMYAGSKITQGLVSSVDTADQYQRQEITVRALNLPKDQQDAITQKAWNDAKVLKFASALDMVKARMAAIGGLGENNVKVIDSLLQTAAKAAHNIQTITGDKSQAGFENMIRNLFGVIEARQQTNDPAAAKRTFDLVQKIYVGTGRKIDIADLETFLRRDATGADKISDEGLAKIVAFLDQAKVSGGHGAGGAGVSTVGTMVKMFQKMANGGLMTEAGAKQFAEAGLMDLSVMDGKEGKRAMRALRQGGLNVADLANSDPVGALQKIADAALAYMSRPENLKKYFPDGDVKDQNAIKNAFMKFAIGTGWSTNAVAMITTAGNHAAMERANASAHTIMNATGVEQMDKDVMGTYAGNVDKFKASWENLKIELGTSVLPIITKLADGLSSVIRAGAEFAKDSPISAAVTAIGLAFGGVVLTINSFLGVVGKVLPVKEVFSAIGGSFVSALSSITGAFSSFGGMIVRMAASISGGFGGLIAKLVSGLGMFGTAVTAAVGVIAKGVTRLIPVIGGLFLAWDFISIVANLEVGGAKVITWAVSWGDRLVTSIKNAWSRVQSIFADEQGKMRLATERTDREMELQKRLRANGVDDGKKPEKTWDERRQDTAREAREEAEREEENKRWRKEQEERKKAEAKRKADEERHKKEEERLDAQRRKKLAAISEGTDDKKKGDRDPLNAAIEKARGDIESSKVKLEGMVSDADYLDNLRKQVAETVEGRRKADEYSPNHLAEKRPAANDKRIQELKELEFQKAVVEEQKKALEFAQQRAQAASGEAESAIERLTSGNAEKQSDAFRALTRELDRASVRLRAGTIDFKDWSAAKAAALYGQSRADAANYAADMVGKTEKMNADNELDPRKKLEEELRVTRETEQAKFEIRMTNRKRSYDLLMAAYDEEIAALKDNSAKQAEVIQKKLFEEQRYANESKTITDAHTKFLEAQAESQRLALRTPIEKMADEWKQTTNAIEQAQVNAANGFVNMLTSSLGKGRMDIRGFLTGVLQDIANAKLKETLASPLKDALTAGGNWVKDNLFGGFSLFGKKQDGKLGESAGADAAVEKLADKASEASESLTNMAAEGVAKAVEATVTDAAATTSSATVTELFSTALSQATIALESFAVQLAASGAAGGGSSFIGAGFSALFGGSGGGGGEFVGPTMEPFMFANGGIMTNFGPVELRKYANGGIANSPQLALYGEAGPEAYVPLPDGRTIPVTITGGDNQPAAGGAGQAPQVTVNVINQTGQQANAQQSGMRFDGKQYILDVVLSAVNQPGAFRSSFKEAVK